MHELESNGTSGQPRGVQRPAPSDTDSAKRQRCEKAPAGPDATEHCENGEAQAPRRVVHLTAAEHEAKAWLTSHYGDQWHSKLHHTHRLMLTGQLLWCRICGHHATGSRAIKLKKQCDGAPPLGSTYATHLSDLKDSKRPKSREKMRERPVAIFPGRLLDSV